MQTQPVLQTSCKKQGEVYPPPPVTPRETKQKQSRKIEMDPPDVGVDAVLLELQVGCVRTGEVMHATGVSIR